MVQSTLLNFFKPQIPKEPGPSSIQGLESPSGAPQGPTSRTCPFGIKQSPGQQIKDDLANESPYSPTLLKLPDVKPYQTPHPSLTVVSVTSESLPQLRRLTGNLLQVKYPDDFFEEAVILEPTSYLSRQVIFTSETGSCRPVGWIRCRLEAVPIPTPPKPQSILSALHDGYEVHPTQIYIQALCLLAPYRGYGAAATLLEAILSDKDGLRAWGVQGVYAHVWEENADALAWYQKRGFKQEGLVINYYRRLKPSGAWIVRLPLDLGEQ